MIRKRVRNRKRKTDQALDQTERMARKAIAILPGMRFGKLLVIGDSPIRSSNRMKFFLCKCDCGLEKPISRAGLISKDTKSCGCLQVSAQQKSPGSATWNQLFYNCKRSAIVREIVFSIEMDLFVKICSGNCAYCGAPPTLRNKYLGKSSSQLRSWSEETIARSFVKANGIDRVNSGVGYVPENLVPCCQLCNEMKMDRSVDQFISQAKRIAQNFMEILK